MIPPLCQTSYLVAFIERLVAQGGPYRDDYAELDAVIQEVAILKATGEIDADDLEELISVFGDAFSIETMQGFAFHKPHGYAGDFEMIDRIYTQYRSQDPRLRKWDDYWQSHAAARAVRNRNDYFAQTITKKVEDGEHCTILNLASGPGRDIYSLFSQSDYLPIHIDCIEQDPKAIRKSLNVCAPYLDQITVMQQNALRLKLPKSYDVIWSAGLFDYFSDKLFCHVLQRLKNLVKEETGEIVIGNFSTVNPSRAYMELFDWKLEHRSPERLRYLAKQCSFQDHQLEVQQEAEGVNLFLHIRG